MNKRINIIAMFMILVLLLCEFDLAASDASYRLATDLKASSTAAQDRALSQDRTPAFMDFNTPESISGRSAGSLFSIRSQSKGRESQGFGLRLLLFFVAVLCLFRIALRHLIFRLVLPGDADASSVILSFIHLKDGKK